MLRSPAPANETRTERKGLGVGIVANEFFDRGLGRMRGFGWAARRAAECLETSDKYRPVLLGGRRERVGNARSTNGIPLVEHVEDEARYGETLAREHLSVFLTIDYRPNYLPVLEARPKTPVLVWVRDPRTPDDVEKIATLEIPGSAAAPQGVAPIDCSSLGALVERARARVTFASLPPPSLRRRPRRPTRYPSRSPRSCRIHSTSSTTTRQKPAARASSSSAGSTRSSVPGSSSSSRDASRERSSCCSDSRTSAAPAPGSHRGSPRTSVCWGTSTGGRRHASSAPPGWS